MEKKVEQAYMAKQVVRLKDLMSRRSFAPFLFWFFDAVNNDLAGKHLTENKVDF